MFEMLVVYGLLDGWSLLIGFVLGFVSCAIMVFATLQGVKVMINILTSEKAESLNIIEKLKKAAKRQKNKEEKSEKNGNNPRNIPRSNSNNI